MRETMGLERARLQELFDLRSDENASHGGGYAPDPYPRLHELRETGPIHEGTVHELLGFEGQPIFQGLPFADRPHFSAFSFAACDQAFRQDELFVETPAMMAPGPDRVGLAMSMITIDGPRHRRYRTLVQPSFVPNKAKWWIERWIARTVHELIDGLAPLGEADLNVDFCAPIPLLTITGSFGISNEVALDLRAAMLTLRQGGDTGALDTFVNIVEPIVAARRVQPQDDLISVLVNAEYTDDDGRLHRLTDHEILSFSFLLLAAGSGTTWKQMGITLLALLTDAQLLERVRNDRALVRAVIEESLRWNPTDPMFSRLVTRDIEFFGTKLPEGAVLHLSVGAANRDPARWERPDEFDPSRPPASTLAFGSGPHVCLGMHVARAEIATGINALLDRLPNLRLDPEAEKPKIVGMYERGPTGLPVLFDRSGGT